NFTSRACKYIEEQSDSDKPFFLYFPLPSPHTPILPTAEFQEKTGTNEYGDYCLMTDDVVGQLMASLEKAGIADNTILVYTSDNGCSPMADFAELAACGHNPSYIFRGHKADIYEGGHRIPLLIRWPEQIKPGTESNETVCLSDMLATCAEILGEQLADSVGEDSVSNLPIWLGTQGDEPLREATVHHSINGSFSIRQGRWKLEFCPGSGGWSYPRPNTDEIKDLPLIQLYDLNADIAERENLQDKQPEIVMHLTKLMTQYVRNGRSTPGTAQENTGPKYWPQLNWMMEK
ncbi:MAG: sulfatase-like hydrolase/transferase, partial [Victivallaceae bacterium]|nr:sulfatase-like hydrolase/transferase [Victivallaceae bacterium]